MIRELGPTFWTTPRRHPLPDDRKEAWRVGTTAHGFEPNWLKRYPFLDLKDGRAHFRCELGDYVILLPDGNWVRPWPPGEIYVCSDGGLKHVGSAINDDIYSIGDIVTGHLDPEALRLRLLKRQDNRDSVGQDQVALTPRKGGPLADLAVSDRFVLSWGQHAKIVDQGSRSTRWIFCEPDPSLPAIQLSSADTQRVTSRSGQPILTA